MARTELSIAESTTGRHADRRQKITGTSTNSNVLRFCLRIWMQTEGLHRCSDGRLLLVSGPMLLFRENKGDAAGGAVTHAVETCSDSGFGK